MLTPAQIELIAKASEYLSGNDIAKGSLFGQRLNPKLNQIIYAERMSLTWMLGQNSSFPTLQDVANYVLWLCGKWWLQANYIINQGGGGQPVTPITPSPLVGSTLNWIEVTKSMFANGTDYVDERLKGKDLSIDGNWLGEKIETKGIQWEYLNDGGVRILIDGFNAKSDDFNDTEVIIRILINGAISAGMPLTTYNYDLSADTEIPGMPTGTDNQTRYVVIKPNGFNYTWASTYIFSDNLPEQPAANATGTKQIYVFMFVAGVGDVCIGQSLNIALT